MPHLYILNMLYAVICIFSSNFCIFWALGFRTNSLKVGGEDVGLQLKGQPWVYTVHHYSSASLCVRPAFQARLLVSFPFDANLVCCYWRFSQWLLIKCWWFAQLKWYEHLSPWKAQKIKGQCKTCNEIAWLEICLFSLLKCGDFRQNLSLWRDLKTWCDSAAWSKVGEALWTLFSSTMEFPTMGVIPL